MPEIRYYEVEQTRKVKVWANNEVDALTVASASFSTNEKVERTEFPGGRQGGTLGDVVITEVNVTREL